MEASDEAKQKVEQEARKRAAQEEAIASAGLAEPEPEENKVQVQCGNCKRNFELPLPEPNVTGFEFDCTNCGAHNQVEL